LGVGGLGVGGWALAPTPHTPIPNPQSPIPNYFFIFNKLISKLILFK